MKQKNGTDNEGNEFVRRRNQPYEASDDTIFYSGEYAVKIEKDGDSYYIYDTKNKEYLSVEGNEYDGQYLGLGGKNEFSEVSISFSNGAAQIVFQGRDTYNVIRSNNIYTSCYNAGQQQDICLYKYIGTEVLDKLDTPTNLIETPEDRQVTIQWDEVDGAVSYTVFVEDEDGNQTKDVVTENMVVVEDLENGYTYSYQIRANASGGAKANSQWTEARQVVPGSGIFELVTSDAMLEAGTRYLVASSATPGSAYTVGAQSGNYRSTVAVTIEDNNTILYNDNYYSLRLEGSTGSWKWKDLKTNKQYLVGGSSKAWCLTPTNTRTDTCSITIDGSASIVYPVNGTNWKVQFNNDRFTCYSSNQKAIYLYKEVGEASIAAPVVEAVGTDRTARLEWSMVQGVTYYLVWNGVESGTPITSPHTISNLTNGTEYTYQVKAVKDDKTKYSAEGTVTPILTKTYQLVTSISSADNGKAFLIVNGKTVGTQLAIGASSQNYVEQQNVRVLNTSPVSIEYSGEDVYKFIFEYSNVNNAWRIRKIDPQYAEELDTESDLYLYTPFDTNTMRTGNSEMMEEDNSDGYENIDLFSITFDSSDGHVNISGIDSALSHRSIRYNGGATRFSFYDTATQAPVYLFKCVD